MTSPAVLADVRLPSFFSDHMVLQRDAPVPVWGQAEPGGGVTARLGGQTREAVADARGAWAVRFDPLPATAPGAPGLTLEVEGGGSGRAVFRDVLVGEVWLCSGQSNMEWVVAEALNAAAETAASAAEGGRIRQFAVPRTGTPAPLDSLALPAACWEPATPASVGRFTAVGYFFAREVSRALGGVPVGLINSAWGGTAIQSWMSVEAIRAEPGRYEALLQAKEKELADWPARLREIEAGVRDWEQRHAAGQPTLTPNPPWNPGPPDLPQWTPTQLYHAMIHPLVPYAVRGVLWYQGESNAGFGKGGAAAYTRLLSDMIRSWRGEWGRGDLPFYLVQLANWNTGAPGASWAWFREGQRAVLAAVPGTGMAVAIDVGTSDDIHPRNKQAVGQRLARLALRRTYGMNVADEGPTFRAACPDGARGMRVEFDHAGGGLVVKGGGSAPRHFEVAGEDRQFHPAEAVIDGSAVVVSCARVEHPVAVRYAWADDPAGCNLCNADDLPAVPFRTDDW